MHRAEREAKLLVRSLQGWSVDRPSLLRCHHRLLLVCWHGDHVRHLVQVGDASFTLGDHLVLVKDASVVAMVIL